MATRVTSKPSRLYEQDFYVWTERQAAALREQRLAELDLAHLAEEIEALGRAARSAILNNAGVVIEHLLKLQHSPASAPRNAWRATVREHRRRLQLDLTPRLGQILAAELPRLYALVMRDTAAALADHGEAQAAAALPEACPFSLEQILGDWLP
jgi:hypothetical protein